MSVSNHRCCFRPVRAGSQIFQPDSGEAGTFGLALTSDGNDRWLLTCWHVISKGIAGSAASDVYQPDATQGPIARFDTAVFASDLDAAAARLIVPAHPDILGIGTANRHKAPVVGMRVVKSGWKTGVTEGIIRHVDGSEVVIERVPGYPDGYCLAAIGDSGAVWLQAQTLSPVALHRGESVVGRHEAYASSFEAVVEALRLRQVSN